MSLRTSDSPHEDGFCTQKLTVVLKDSALVTEVAECFTAIFNDRGRGEPAEDWTDETARRKLFLAAAPDTDRSHLTTWRVQGRLAGLCLTYFDRTARSFRLNDLPPGCRSQEVLDLVLEKLAVAAGPDSLMIQYREMGIRRSCRRGLQPVLSLIMGPGVPPLRAGADYVAFYCSSRGRLYPIVVGLGLQPIHDFGDAADNRLMFGSAVLMQRRLTRPAWMIRTMIAVRLGLRKIGSVIHAVDGRRRTAGAKLFRP